MFNQATIDFLLGRGLEPETADRCGLSTVNITSIKGASVLAFDYIRREVLHYQKFRLLPKERFWREPVGKRPLFWNGDALDDPVLEAGQMPLVICEGELDALTAIQCGFPLAVSVPDGAPPASTSDLEDFSGSSDQTGKFEFIDRERSVIKKIKKFILATDNDAPGQRLREELLRRLSPARCSFVQYPHDCKDLNDILIKYGPENVTLTLNRAKPCPVKGVYRLSDYPKEEKLRVFSSGWPLLDRHFQMIAGEFVVITGIPQHGKSSFTLQLLANMRRLHGWRSAVFSPEMRVTPIIRDRMRSFSGLSAKPDQDAWIDDSFLFIGSNPRGEDDEDDFDLDWIIDRAVDAVYRYGIRILLIDPWNEVEHARERGEAETDYIARGIRALKRFSRRYDVAVIVVAHPTKMPRAADGNFEAPSLYDISGSAAWYNKADHGIVVRRRFDLNQSEIIVAKSRFDEAGGPGMVRMLFDPLTWRFDSLQETQDAFQSP